MGEKKFRGLMSSGVKKRGSGASTPCCFDEKPAARQKEFVVNNEQSHTVPLRLAQQFSA